MLFVPYVIIMFACKLACIRVFASGIMGAILVRAPRAIFPTYLLPILKYSKIKKKVFSYPTSKKREPFIYWYNVLDLTSICVFWNLYCLCIKNANKIPTGIQLLIVIIDATWNANACYMYMNYEVSYASLRS